ncbi:Bi1-like protein [Quillaja saponaria]|uniref:Bi1-like protein n=1 Tax=Quillaja saponaria TaxID=32244 RepID=A0AAD7PGQ5_QUISA|nr:Bi1-like protein [Quillaja saponaria]
MARSSRSTRLKEASRKLEIISNQFRRIAEKAINSGSVTEAELDVEVREVLESGRDQLVENQRKWAFLSKVYAILSAHWALTAIVFLHHHLLLSHPKSPQWKMDHSATVSLPCALLHLLVTWYLATVPLPESVTEIIKKNLSDFTLIRCFQEGIFVLELFGLTSAACFYLFGYTFLASIKDNLDEFNAFKPSAISCFCIFILTGFAQIFFPYALLAGL